MPLPEPAVEGRRRQCGFALRNLVALDPFFAESGAGSCAREAGSRCSTSASAPEPGRALGSQRGTSGRSGCGCRRVAVRPAVGPLPAPATRRLPAAAERVALLGGGPRSTSPPPPFVAWGRITQLVPGTVRPLRCSCRPRMQRAYLPPTRSVHPGAVADAVSSERPLLTAAASRRDVGSRAGGPRLIEHVDESGLRRDGGLAGRGSGLADAVGCRSRRAHPGCCPVVIGGAVDWQAGGRRWMTTIDGADEELPPPGPPEPSAAAYRIEPVTPVEQYLEAVRAVRDAVRDGGLTKAVISPRDRRSPAIGRSIATACSTGSRPRSGRAYFALDGFLGASPELLVEVDGPDVRSRPLAGTARTG